MGKFEGIASTANRQERRHRRFCLSYPVRVRFDSGDGISEFQTVSRNISLGGMLLEAEILIPQFTEVSFVLTLQGQHMVHPVDLAGNGQVVRVQRSESGAGYVLALQCSRPLVDTTNLA